MNPAFFAINKIISHKPVFISCDSIQSNGNPLFTGEIL